MHANNLAALDEERTQNTEDTIDKLGTISPFLATKPKMDNNNSNNSNKSNKSNNSINSNGSNNSNDKTNVNKNAVDDDTDEKVIDGQPKMETHGVTYDSFDTDNPDCNDPNMKKLSPKKNHHKTGSFFDLIDPNHDGKWVDIEKDDVIEAQGAVARKSMLEHQRQSQELKSSIQDVNIENEKNGNVSNENENKTDSNESKDDK